MARVGLIMGSDSDWPQVKKAADVLDGFGVEWEAVVASAHRSPERVTRWVREAPQRGVQVIIAAAGLAAHLPGVVAAQTTLPVIGLPIEAGALRGVDALYSIVQMPPGVPVATVGINAGRNAACWRCKCWRWRTRSCGPGWRITKRKSRRSAAAADRRLQEMLKAETGE